MQCNFTETNIQWKSTKMMILFCSAEEDDRQAETIKILSPENSVIQIALH